MKQLTRLSVAELKQIVNKPEVVEVNRTRYTVDDWINDVF